MRADLLLVGRIATRAGGSGFGWVEAIAVTDGRVVLAGSEADVLLPGLTDGHMHLPDVALATDEIDLSDSPSLEDGLGWIVAAHAATADPDAWLEGHGWDAVPWGGWPVAALLDTHATQSHCHRGTSDRLAAARSVHRRRHARVGRPRCRRAS
jgi:predicted amidohydrolase YtcJ